MDSTRLSDYRFFTECLDTSIPALASLPALAETGDFAAAYHIFADYVRTHLDVDTYMAGQRELLKKDEATVRADAERVFQHRFISCRVPHTFGEVIDWEANPTYNGYREWPWQLNRHPEWRILAKYYFLTGDDAAAAEWEAQLLSWARQAQVPENASGFATVCWRTIEAGIRMSTWAYAIHAFLASPSLSDTGITVFFKSIWEHGWRLRNFSTARNWLIHELHGLVRIGLLYPFLRDGEEWLAYAHRRLEAELHIQVYADGMQSELSMGYHSVVLNHYTEVLKLYRRLGLVAPSYLTEGLERLNGLYPRLVRPDLFCPTMNDGGHVRATGYLRTAMQLFPEREDFRYIATERAEGKAPDYTSCFMEYGGAAIFRSSWEADAVWAYADLSPFGTAHQHEDKLNMQIYAYGHELLPEAGTFDYDSSEMRRYVLSTRGHNTARIDGMDQNSRARYEWKDEYIERLSDSYFCTTDTRDTAEASYTAGYGAESLAVTHTRRILFLKREAGLPPLFVVIDRFAAPDGAPHRYELLWHMHDNPTVVYEKKVRNTYPDGVGITISASTGEMTLVRGQYVPEFQGWLPRYGIGDVEHFPIPTAIFRGDFTGSCRVVTVLEPFCGGNSAVRGVAASDDAADTTLTLILEDGREIAVTE